MKIFIEPSFMIVPSLACQAKCSYCFGPHSGPLMSLETVHKVAGFIAEVSALTRQKSVSVTLHGGEPLLAPEEVFEGILDTLTARLQGRADILWSLQSNLWAMSDAFGRLLQKFNVSVGTSIDGPRDICDKTRGKGYWEKTMRGIAKAREYGLDVGGIATITRETLDEFPAILSFYCEQNLNMNLHPAVSSLDHPESQYALSGREYSGLLHSAIPLYLKHRKHIAITTLDNFSKAQVTNESSVCTFKDCLGMFLAIDPEGYIFPCQRFCGRPEFALGNVYENPSLEELQASSIAQRMIDRQNQVARRCRECEDYPYCKGGCFYNALAGGDGIIDPLCEAYKSTHKLARTIISQEMASEDNITAIATRPPRDDENLLMRKGPFISLSGSLHPRRIAANAKALLCIYALAREKDPVAAARYVVSRNICKNLEVTTKVIRQYHNRLRNPDSRLNNLYAHVTFQCNLKCTHCYAEAGNQSEIMNPDFFCQLLQETRQAGFRQFIITGGEPLVHPEIDALLEHCKRMRGCGTNLVLRTNLTGVFSDSFFLSIADSFDQIVASVDGNQSTHDERRGKGTYDILVENLRRYQNLIGRIHQPAELSLACCMDSELINGEPGAELRSLARQLGVQRVRFRPVLPLGRASQWKESPKCEGLQAHLLPEDLLGGKFNPLYTCGIGQNLYINPDGNSFPCYAYHRPHTHLGNVLMEGLAAVLHSEKFKALAKSTVDTIERCRDCDVRYLCGGACRAWGGNYTQYDLNAAPPRCDHLREKAYQILDVAVKYLELN